jgi:hypothetical protein
MSKLALTTLALLALCAACTNGAPEPQAPPAATPAAAPPSPAPAPAAAASLDLSTAEKARATIYEVLKRGDKEAFKTCVSKRVLVRQGEKFDAWYGVWKAAADRGAESFKKIAVTQEDGVYKLDEI